MYFHSVVNNSSFYVDLGNMIIDADAYMISEKDYDGVKMTIQFSKVSYGYSYLMFLKAYKESSELLRVYKIKKKWLKIDEEKIVLIAKTE